MNYKLFILWLISSCFVATVFGQQSQYVYYFDKDLNSTKKSNATIYAKGYKDDGLLKLYYFDNETGILLMSVHFTDSTLSVMQGQFQSFYPHKDLKEEGLYENGKMQGLWQQWDDKGLKTDSAIYENDYKIRYAKFEHYNRDKTISSYAFTDSLQNTFVEKYISEKGIVTSEVNFYGQNGLLKIYDSTGVKISADSVFSREEREADFPGGRLGWNTYLKKNLRADVPSNHGAPNGMYTVVVKFVITKDGKLADITTETNPGYGIANEAIRIIKESPNWIPAIQYGRLVNAYRRQPITFMVDNGR